MRSFTPRVPLFCLRTDARPHLAAAAAAAAVRMSFGVLFCVAVTNWRRRGSSSVLSATAAPS